LISSGLPINCFRGGLHLSDIRIMASIILEQVEKKFGEEIALYPSSFSVEEGEFIVLVGPSGCGKTTFLRLIAGLEDVSAGKIFIEKEDITWMEPKNRGIGMVFQNYALYPHMTVLQNLQYPLNILKLKKEEKKKRIQDVSKILEIDSLLSRKPAELSGGQQQRVAIGRALVRQPRIFLFDEPLSNLDARLREQMRQEIASLHKKLKRTTIYVTHDQHEAMTLGDRLVVMNKGKIIQQGKPLELYQNPDSLFIARFLGNPPMNTLPGKLHGGNFFQGKFGELRLSESSPYEESDLVLGLRPEELSFKDKAGGDNSLSGVVISVENLGREAHVQVKTGDIPVWVVTNEQPPHTGDLVHLRISSKHMLWFDGKTEKRIH